MSDTKTAAPMTGSLNVDIPVGSRELTPHEPGGAVAPADLAAFNAHSMMAMVERLALDERIDAGKLETVMRVANQQQDREREIQFYQDKNRAVREMPLIRKDGKIVILDKNNPTNMDLARVQGHFERWPDVQAAITPVLDRHHLTLTHKVGHADGQTVVIAVLAHDNGYREESGEMRLPLDTSGGKNNVQGAGSSQTYGMRYTARAICGLKLVGGQGDDNGNLIPLPDEPLNDQQERRIKEGKIAWKESPEKFDEWMGTMQPKDRMWFIQAGYFAEITGRNQLPGTSPAPRNTALALDPGEHDVTTPEGWTADYEAQCASAVSLEYLQEVQKRGSKAMARLAEGGHTALHERAIKAGSDAYARLAPADEGGE